MTNDRTATLQRLAQEETRRFIDESFGQLDLSGCISLLTPPSEDAQLPDERFAPLDDRGLGLGSSALKRAVEDLANDPEVQEQVARETGNPELLKEWQYTKAEQVARDFMRQNPSYFRCQENWETLVHTLALNALGWHEDMATTEEAQEELIKRGCWIVENLASAFKALFRQGVLEVKPGRPRTITERERRAIALQASSGDIEGAIARYLLRRAPEEKADAFMDAPTTIDALDEVADPELARVVSEAVWYCWTNGRPNYSPTPERRKFMQEYVAGRIPTARLLDEAWAACQAAERDTLRSGLLQQVSEPDDTQHAPNLDGLSDEAIDSLYHRTLRKVAEDSRSWWERTASGEVLSVLLNPELLTRKIVIGMGLSA
jgi:hypothetical protein